MSAEYRRHLVEWAREDAASKGQDWPGTPLSQIPLAAKDDLHALLDAGTLRIVERKSRTWADRTVSYVAPTDA